jgi:hypothetical protein
MDNDLQIKQVTSDFRIMPKRKSFTCSGHHTNGSESELLRDSGGPLWHAALGTTGKHGNAKTLELPQSITQDCHLFRSHDLAIALLQVRVGDALKWLIRSAANCNNSVKSTFVKKPPDLLFAVFGRINSYRVCTQPFNVTHDSTSFSCERAR